MQKRHRLCTAISRSQCYIKATFYLIYDSNKTVVAWSLVSSGNPIAFLIVSINSTKNRNCVGR